MQVLWLSLTFLDYTVTIKSLWYASIPKELHLTLTVYQTQRLKEIEWRHPTAFTKERSGRPPYHDSIWWWWSWADSLVLIETRNRTILKSRPESLKTCRNFNRIYRNSDWHVSHMDTVSGVALKSPKWLIRQVSRTWIKLHWKDAKLLTSCSSWTLDKPVLSQPPPTYHGSCSHPLRI